MPKSTSRWESYEELHASVAPGEPVPPREERAKVAAYMDAMLRKQGHPGLDPRILEENGWQTPADDVPTAPWQ